MLSRLQIFSPPDSSAGKQTKRLDDLSIFLIVGLTISLSLLFVIVGTFVYRRNCARWVILFLVTVIHRRFPHRLRKTRFEIQPKKWSYDLYKYIERSQGFFETEYISHVIFSWTFLKEITFIGTLTSTAPIQTQTLSVVKRMQAMLHWAIVQPVSMNYWI